MPYWDERVKAVAESYPDVRWDQYHIDILTAHFVLNPDRFDVVVASNLFGDILSDLGPLHGHDRHRAVGQHQPGAAAPVGFEPVHGSAPDIAGQGIANPIGQIWSGAMMLEHLASTRPPGDRQRDRAGAVRADAADARSRRQCRHAGLREGRGGGSGSEDQPRVLRPSSSRSASPAPPLRAERREVGVEMAVAGQMYLLSQGYQEGGLVGFLPRDEIPARFARTVCTTMMVRPFPSRNGWACASEPSTAPGFARMKAESLPCSRACSAAPRISRGKANIRRSRQR